MKNKFFLIAGTIVLASIQQHAGAQTLYTTVTGASTNTFTGINTNAPVGRLEIKNDCIANSSPLQGGLVVTGTSPFGACSVGSSVRDNFIVRSQTGSSAYRTDFVIKQNSGMVGIGTSNPLDMLNLGTGKIRLGDATNYLQLVNNTTYQELIATGNMTLKASTLGISLMTNNALRMYITQTTTTGYTRVGVNTTSPEEALHVYNGSLKLTGTDPVHGAPNIFWGGTPTVAPNGEWALEYNSSDTDPNKRGMNFWKPSGATGGFGNYFLFLGNNGNVGIGTNNATAKLTVNGKVLIGNPTLNINTVDDYRLYVEKGILTEKIKVALSTTWADFVFDTDYKANSIDSVSNFIETHHHLPNVPSAAEISEKGIDVAAMDAILLRQIEELWLHVIRLQEENNNLKYMIQKSGN